MLPLPGSASTLKVPAPAHIDCAVLGSCNEKKGKSLTVTVVTELTLHPLELVTVYVMVAVPADTPVTKPVLFTLATPALEDDQTPILL